MALEENFVAVWARSWDAMDRLGIRTARVRKLAEEHGVLETAHRILRGRTCSDGFTELAAQGKLEISLEALVLESRWGSLFTDEEANEAIARLMDAGYHFQPRRK